MSSRLALKNCALLNEKLQENGLSPQTLTVPVDYADPAGEKLEITYWVRKALSPEAGFPPLLLIHGGPGGSSSRFLDWKAVFDHYPGDIVSLDVRGDGCSSAVDMTMDVDDYVHFRARNIVHDLEELRRALYDADTKWRVFGQSRGSITAHYYLDMFPDALESLHLHGYSMGSAATMQDYSKSRAFFSARASQAFIEKYPEAGQALQSMKEWLEAENIRFDFYLQENPALTHYLEGAVALDALSFELTNQSNWPVFAKTLEDLNAKGILNEKAARNYLQSKIQDNSYVVGAAYIAGTNAQDVGHPNLEILSTIKDDPYVEASLICEGRFIGEVIAPWYKAQHGGFYEAGCDPIDHASILEYLKSKVSFQFNLYASANDPVAGPEAFDDERTAFDEHINYQVLNDSGHDGWRTDPAVAKNILKL